MSEAIFDKSKIEVKAQSSKVKSKESDSYLLIARGEVEKFDGFLRVYQRSQGSQEDKEEDRLPEVSEGESLEFIDLDPQQKFTKPPARYSEASLIKKLESEGIGRPSTYAPIISTIQERNYIEKEEGKFYPTLLGKSVNDFLVANFNETVNVEFTAKMESQLDEVAKGKEKWQDILGEFYKPFGKKLSKVEKTAQKVKVPVEKTGESCPDCKDGELIIRIGKFGKFIACDKFPKCKYSASFVEKAGIDCPKCGREMVVKFTKKKKRFYGCSNYPDCKFAAWKKSQINI
jgi:DNA topoisomerase-1